MNRRWARVPVAALGLILAAGCATTTEDGRSRSAPSVRAGEFGTPDCFWNSPALNFETLDSRNLIVFASGRRDAYHVQVGLSSAGLRMSSQLGFVSGGSRICGYAGDALLLSEGFSSRSERLPILGVYRLDDAALAGLRSRFGRAPPAEKIEPQPGPGPAIQTEPEGESADDGTAKQQP